MFQLNIVMENYQFVEKYPSLLCYLCTRTRLFIHYKCPSNAIRTVETNGPSIEWPF